MRFLMENDFSAFSKKNVVLTSDSVNTNTYLEFAKKGGNIIVLNTDNSFTGGFSNLLCIKPYKETEFNSIANSEGRQYMKILGVARDIGVYCQGSIIKSFYINNGHEVAPFVIEKKYGNGKIIFVNISGYFKTLSKYSDRFFLTLGSITDLIGLHAEKFTKTVTLNSAPIPYFIGDLNMSGPVIINSSSLLLSKNYDLYVQNISITKQKSTNLFYQSPLNQTNFNNTQVRDLKIYGAYNVVINSIDLSYVPSPSSPYNYIQLHLPVGSNMTIKLSNGSRAEFFIGEDNNQQPVKVSDGRIEFKRIKSGLLSDVTTSIPVLMKNPEITINKKASFQAGTFQTILIIQIDPGLIFSR